MDLNPLNQLNGPGLITMAIVAAVFLATYVALRKFFVLPYLKVMRERTAMVEAASAERDEAQRAIEGGRLQAEQLLADASEEAERIVAAAREESLELKRTRIAAATKDVSSRLEKGRQDIAAARENAMSLLREQAVQCVGLACHQLLGSKSDRSAEEAVDKLLGRYVQ